MFWSLQLSCKFQIKEVDCTLCTEHANLGMPNFQTMPTLCLNMNQVKIKAGIKKGLCVAEYFRTSQSTSAINFPSHQSWAETQFGNQTASEGLDLQPSTGHQER